VEKFKAMIKKNSTVLYLLLFCIVTVVNGRVPSNLSGDLNISELVIAEEDGEGSILAVVLAPIIRDALTENNKTLKAEIMLELDKRFAKQELKELNKDINEIALALSEVRTAPALEDILLFWHEENWTSKITSIQSIGENSRATEKLRELLYFFPDELFNRLMTYYK
jgi:hypothetical protein